MTRIHMPRPLVERATVRAPLAGRAVVPRHDRSEIEAHRVAEAVAPSAPTQQLAHGRLPAATRAWADRAFGFDFGNVRIHADDEAAGLARSLDARAFTVGSDVYVDRAELGGARRGRVVAHELAHVVQQTAGAGHVVAGTALGPVVGAPIQRDAKEELEKKVAEVAEAKAEIDEQWKEIRALGTSATLKPFVTKGDQVVEFLGEHVQLAIADLRAGASITELTTVIENDLAAYGFVAWHVVVGANLEGMKGDLEDLVDSFDADDREFTGRAAIEDFNRATLQLVKDFPKAATAAIARLKTHRIELTVSGGRTKFLNITNATSDLKELEYFLLTAIDLRNKQAALQVGVEATWKFLDNAFEEGLVQAGAAFVEFVTARGGKRGGPKRTGKGRPKASKPEKKPKKRDDKGDAEKKKKDEAEAEKKKKDEAEEEKKKKDEEEKKKQGCASKHPGLRLCSSLGSGYLFPSHVAALAAVKAQSGEKNATIGSKRVAARGPCPGEGNHWRVTANGDYLASLVSCPCCKEIGGQALKVELWSILWH